MSFHFIAIGGVGQSGLAKILAQNGFEITGSDVISSKYTKALEKLGVKISIGHNPSNIHPGQKIVLSSAIKEDNPELIRAKELGLSLYHRSDILKLISEKYPCFIGFSGTHGKTTTSSLCAYVLEKGGYNPSYAVGGIITGLETNANAAPDGKIFIAELDESDGTIVKYSPDFVVINNLEPDHFDFYKNGEKDLILQFDKFYKNLKNNAKLLLNVDDKGVRDFIKTIDNKKNLTYSIERPADYSAKNINDNEFDFYKGENFIARIKTQLTGLHNITNILSVLSVLSEKGIDVIPLVEHFYSFTGAKRRFETVYEGCITIVDDYAHHPTEIKATLEAAKKRSKGRIVVIFQPHRYTRLKALYLDFQKSFGLADKLFVLDTYSAGDPFDFEYNSKNFAEKTNAVYVKGNVENAAEVIFNYLKEGDFVITIGAGDVTKTGYILRGYYEKRRN